ncbi:MAG: hypothetical protein DWQ01_05285 [Planctomycetota bacterium]|nr:MAG: hypothetical protein DWQ01_05285 [Planctomycetota bacterium]
MKTGFSLSAGLSLFVILLLVGTAWFIFNSEWASEPPPAFPSGSLVSNQVGQDCEMECNFDAKGSRSKCQKPKNEADLLLSKLQKGQVIWSHTGAPASHAFVQCSHQYSGELALGSWAFYSWNLSEPCGVSETSRAGLFDLRANRNEDELYRALWGENSKWSSEPVSAKDLRRGQAIALATFEPGPDPAFALQGRLTGIEKADEDTAGATVVLSVNEVVRGKTVANTDGQFLFPEVLLPADPLPYSIFLYASSSSGLSGTWRGRGVNPGEWFRGIEIHLEQPDYRKGRVVSQLDLGRGIAGAQLRLWRENKDGGLETGPLEELVSDSEGFFRITSPQQRRLVEISARHPEFGPAWLVEEEIKAAGSEEMLVLALPPKGSLSGKVLEFQSLQKGSRVQVGLSFDRKARWDSQFRRRVQVVDRQGAFSFSDLAPGTYWVGIWEQSPVSNPPVLGGLGNRPLEKWFGLQKVVLAPGEEKEISLKVSPTQSLSGRVEDIREAGAWVVSFHSVDGQLVAQVESDTTGSFALETDFLDPGFLTARRAQISFDEKGSGYSEEAWASFAGPIRAGDPEVRLQVLPTRFEVEATETMNKPPRVQFHLHPLEAVPDHWKGLLHGGYEILGVQSGFRHLSFGLPTGSYQVEVKVAGKVAIREPVRIQLGGDSALPLPKLLHP